MLFRSSSRANGRGVNHAVRLSFALATLFLASSGMLFSACGGDDTSTGGKGGNGAGGGTAGSGGDQCEGGVIVNGVCEGKCTPDKCIAENTCVGNRCVLVCDTQKDCYPDGSQSCLPAVEDDTGAQLTTCQFHGKSAGIGTPCPFLNECGNWYSCPDGGTCFPFQCGGDPAACVVDEAACTGVDNCTFGKCAADGAPCRVNCQTECGAWLACESKGEGDGESYCTNRDCGTDDDCLAGYYCGVIHDPHEVCGSSPKKGDNTFCGATSEPCIAVGADGKATDGSSRFEGSVCMLRNSCLKRTVAAACTSDLDCTFGDGLKCITFAEEQRCASICGSNLDCPADFSCDPGLLTCVPKFGKWKGAGQGFCEPCQSDEDCGGNGTTWACLDLTAGMRACIDLSFPVTCNGDADCPVSPSGKSGSCLSDNTCYFPVNFNTGVVSCW